MFFMNCPVIYCPLNVLIEYYCIVLYGFFNVSQVVYYDIVIFDTKIPKDLDVHPSTTKVLMN